VAVTSRIDYEHTLQALGICVSARVPVLLWGNPGEGKTAAVESARDLGWHVETVIITHSEPSDFAGLPVIGPDGAVSLAPPAWARRLATAGRPSIAFFDEFSTASPSLQAAALRPLTHYEVGALQLPETVAFVAAANPSDVAAAGVGARRAHGIPVHPPRLGTASRGVQRGAGQRPVALAAGA
jgi:MoxR-like ATPase